MQYKHFAFFVLLILLAACTPKTTVPTVTAPPAKPDPEAFRKHAPAPDPAPVIQIGDYQTFTLDNGLTVIVVEDHKIPAIDISLDVDVPPFYEKDKAGLSSLAGTLMAAGTKSRTKADIDEAVDFIGAYLTTWATGMYANCLSKHKDALLDVMSDVLLHPTFPEKEFEKERKRTLSGLAQQQDDPNAIARNVGHVLNFGKNHPYGEVATEETVKNITRDDLVKYYQTYYRPNISYLVLTGDITPDEAKELANKYFGSWQKADVPRVELPAVKPPQQTSVAMVNKNGAVQSQLLITYPLDLKPNSPDLIKTRVANGLLGGFFGSRINKNLREDKAYTYGAHTSIRPDREIARFRGGAAVRNEVTDSAIVQFLYEMKRIRESKPAPEEMKRVKSVLSGQFARSLEDKRTVARFAVNTIKYHLPKDYYANYLKNLNAVTAEDIQAMARKYIKPDQAYVIVVGNQDEVVERLQNVQAPGGIKYYDRYGNPIAAPKKDVGEMTAKQVIERYLKAIGGREAIAKIKTIRAVAGAEAQGQQVVIKTIGSTQGKGMIDVLVGGQPMQKIVFNNGKGYQMAMGQKMPLEQKMLEGLKTEILPVKEMAYDQPGYQLELKGIETIDGKEAYKVVVTTPAGTTQTNYYDVKSGLKLQQVTRQNGMNLPVTYSDYKSVQGVLFPYTFKQTVPMPMTFHITDIRVNVPLKDEDFKVD